MVPVLETGGLWEGDSSWIRQFLVKNYLGEGAGREEPPSLYQGGTSVYPLLRRQRSKLRGGRTYEAFATSSLSNTRSHPPFGWDSFPSSLSADVPSSGAALRYSLSSLLMSLHSGNA